MIATTPSVALAISNHSSVRTASNPVGTHIAVNLVVRARMSVHSAGQLSYFFDKLTSTGHVNIITIVIIAIVVAFWLIIISIVARIIQSGDIIIISTSLCFTHEITGGSVAIT